MAHSREAVVCPLSLAPRQYFCLRGRSGDGLVPRQCRACRSGDPERKRVVILDLVGASVVVVAVLRQDASSHAAGVRRGAALLPPLGVGVENARSRYWTARLILDRQRQRPVNVETRGHFIRSLGRK